MSLPELLPATHPSFLITFAHLSQQTLKGRQGRQGRHEHPHFIDGEAEAGPPGADGPGNLGCHGYYGASVLHRLTFCGQLPSCPETGLASHKLPWASGL